MSLLAVSGWLLADAEPALYREKLGVERGALLATGPAPEDTQDDYLLAQMLQLEYDKEHDLQLRAEERHFNKHSKGISTKAS